MTDTAPDEGDSVWSAGVWIFHGDDARHAAGVFAELDDALAWAARHSVSGLITNYPIGDGCYDIALKLGRFSPSRPHHGTPTHVAGFSPGWTHHVHVADGHEV